MKSRALTTTALVAVAVLGLTGCGAITPMATTIQYSPAEGANVPDAEGAPILIRNALVVSDATGRTGNLVAAVINSSDEDQVLNLEWGSQTEAIDVPAGETISFGTEQTEPLALSNLDTPAGATVSMYFQSGAGEGVLSEVPVLDGCEAQFAALTPSGSVPDDCTQDREPAVDSH